MTALRTSLKEFRSICLFVCLYLCIFVSLSARLRENGCHEIFREGVEWPRDDLVTFLSIPRNRARPRCATRERGLLCFRTTVCCVFDSVAVGIQKAAINISQGSGPTHLRCGGSIIHHTVANFQQSVPVNEFRKSVNILRSYDQVFYLRLTVGDRAYIGLIQYNGS